MCLWQKDRDHEVDDIVKTEILKLSTLLTPITYINSGYIKKKLEQNNKY